jgi:hypothetical protein
MKEIREEEIGMKKENHLFVEITPCPVKENVALSISSDTVAIVVGKHFVLQYSDYLFMMTFVVSNVSTSCIGICFLRREGSLCPTES